MQSKRSQNADSNGKLVLDWFFPVNQLHVDSENDISEHFALIRNLEGYRRNRKAHKTAVYKRTNGLHIRD